jgi:Kdo2-lipid IVA lauroyltransferase/acyltransferase
MSAKKRSALVDYLVYLTVRALVCVLQGLSPEAARGCARFLAWLAYTIDKRHRLVALENLEKAYPGHYTAAELDDLVRRVYRHFCTLVIEIVQIPRKLHVNNWKDHIVLDDGHRIVDCLLSGRPLLIVTGHFGNWELAGYALGMFGFTTHAIARPLDNVYLDNFLRGFREKTGQKMLAKRGDFEQMEKLLQNGGVLATLADQDAGQRGLFVDFFGRPASTHKAIALLAIEHNAPVVVGYARRIGPGFRYEVGCDAIIEPSEWTGGADDVRLLTQRYTTALENIVRRSPEQYLWLHRRWKHQPKPKSAGRVRLDAP